MGLGGVKLQRVYFMATSPTQPSPLAEVEDDAAAVGADPFLRSGRA